MLRGFLPGILDGAIVTLTVALCSLAIAVVLGLAGAAMKLSASRTLKIMASVYTTVIRGAIIAIPPGQREAGIAYGMTPRMVFVRIVFPQMVRFALPGFANNWLVLVKSTALVSIIGLADMMNRAGMAAGATREPFTFYMAVAALYLVITTVSVLLLKALDRRYSLGVKVASL